MKPSNQESQKVSKGNCKVCNCHLPPEEIPPEQPNPYPSFEPYSPPELLRKKTEREKVESEVEKSIKSESESESEEFEEAAPDVGEDRIKRVINEKAYNLCKKKWELKEEQELLKIKEEEIALDDKEIDIEVKKMDLKEVEKEIKAKEVQLKNLYVKQLNLQNLDGEDEEEKAKEEYDLEMTIESLEASIELLKSKGMGLELMIADARRKIMAGRAKIAKERNDLKTVKEIREREMKEEEEGKWPGEPRWII